MRKVISFSVAASLLIGGIYLLLAYTTRDASVPIPGKFAKFVWMGGVTMIGLGGFWLWADFIAPAFGKHVDD